MLTYGRMCEVRVCDRDKISRDSRPWGFEPLVSTTRLRRLRLLSSVLLGKSRYTDTTNLTEPNVKLELSFYLQTNMVLEHTNEYALARFGIH